MADRNSDWMDLVGKVAEVGKVLLPLVVPGAAPAVLAAAGAVIDLIDHTKDMVDGDVDVAELDATRDAMEAGISARVKKTVDTLRGST